MEKRHQGHRKAQQAKNQAVLIKTGLVFALLIGISAIAFKGRDLLGVLTGSTINSAENTRPNNESSEVLPLVNSSPQIRESKLQEIASESKDEFDRDRARYLLAVDLINNYHGGPALKQLDDLEDDYKTLAPYILLKKARAYELSNEKEEAQETWKKVIEEYPDSSALAEAYYMLGKTNKEYGDKALSQFPSHPLTIKLIRERLKEQPDNYQLLLQLAKYAPTERDSNKIRDRLVQDYANDLKTTDWETLANSYWEQREYDKAIQAYTKATISPLNLYRIARGLEILDKKTEAISAYQKLVNSFPDAKETSNGLLRLAAISGSQEAIGYLENIIAKFPEQTPEALLQKIEVLEKNGNSTDATAAKDTLLKTHSKTEAAAKYRWKIAQKYAKAGDLTQAWEWAREITVNNSDSSLAAESAFWIGKWATQLGKEGDAQTYFKQAIASQPQSYYAWRSAVFLGWNVGDFSTVRQMNPDVNKSIARGILPAGSDAVKELYLLGQNNDAWGAFIAETANKPQLSVEEQLTKGILLLSLNKNIQGIGEVWSLKERNDPNDRQKWLELRKNSEYWYALFPFPYESLILKWGQQYQVNSLLVTSLIRQESRFEPEIASSVGAVGLMQVMPDTAKWVAQQIDLNNYSLIDPNDNINLGTYYLNMTHKQYNDNSLFAIASYNAGPGNVDSWKQRFSYNDPDAFVENIPFPETKDYVESVFGNYWNYLRIYNSEIAQMVAQVRQQTVVAEKSN
jgi:soluble lytic murein transglycosylase